jgi:hypothetical protein
VQLLDNFFGHSYSAMVNFSLTWISAIYLCLSVSFVYLGHMGQRAIGNANKCEMTYSRPQQIQIPINSSIDNYKLYKHINGQAGKTNDDAIPVLFVPGNSGS